MNIIILTEVFLCVVQVVVVKSTFVFTPMKATASEDERTAQRLADALSAASSRKRSCPLTVVSDPELSIKYSGQQFRAPDLRLILKRLSCENIFAAFTTRDAALRGATNLHAFSKKFVMAPNLNAMDIFEASNVANVFVWDSASSLQTVNNLSHSVMQFLRPKFTWVCLYCGKDGDHSLRTVKLREIQRVRGLEHLPKSFTGNAYGAKLRLRYNLLGLAWFLQPDRSVSGVEKQYNKLLARHFNFTFQSVSYSLLFTHYKCKQFYRASQIKGYGSIRTVAPNGSWSGLTGELQRRHVDISANSMAMNGHRGRVVSYSRVLWSVSEISILTEIDNPGNAGGKWRGLLSPFSPRVWAFLFCVVLFGGLVAWFVGRFAPPEARSWRAGDRSRPLFIAWKILCQQSLRNEELPRMWRPSMRIFHGTWFFYALLLMAIYTESLVAHFAVKPKPVYIETVDQLEASGRSWWTRENTALDSTFRRRPKLDARHKTWKYGTVNEALDRVLEEPGKHCILIARSPLKMWTTKYRSDKIPGIPFPFHRSRENAINLPTTFAYPKRSPLQESFDRYLQRMMEAGIMQHTARSIIRENRVTQFTTEYSRMVRKSLRVGSHNLEAITVSHFLAAFTALGIGSSLGFIVFVAEVLFFKTQQRKRRPRFDDDEDVTPH